MPATDGRVNSGNRAKAFDLSVRGDALAEMKGRLTSNGETVNFKEGMSREKAHEAVDRLDRHLRAQIPGIARVVGHADPLPV